MGAGWDTGADNDLTAAKLPPAGCELNGAGLEDNSDMPDPSDCSWQSHVHEFLNSTSLTGEGVLRHNHRFAGMSGEAIYVPGSHVHRITARTDYHDHYHEIHLISGPATFLLDQNARKSDRKHVHFAEGFTTNVDRHRHQIEFVTLIEAPLDAEDSSYRD